MAPTRSSRPRARTTVRASGRAPTAEARSTAASGERAGARSVTSAGAGMVVWLLVALVAGVGACSGGRHSPAELIDGSRATPPSVPLDAPTPQILTKVSVVQPPRE